MENDKIIWNSPEYIFHEKSREWFLVLWIIAIALCITAVLLKNYLFCVMVIIATFAITLFAKRPPDVGRFEINRSGLIIKNTFYPYSSLLSFWIDNTDPNWQKLMLTSRKTFMTALIVPLGDQNADEVRNFLNNYLFEKEQYEPLSHRLMEYFGF